jgi:hypothetical protein
MHGLLFGGFKVTSFFEQNSTGLRVYGEPDYYRSFGNHRIATHLRKQGWDIECLDYLWKFSYDELTDYVDKRITKDTVFIGVSLLFYAQLDAVENINKLFDYVRKKYPWVKVISGGVKGYAITCVNADYFIAGNGEYAIDAVLKYLMGQGEPPKETTLDRLGTKIIDTTKDYPCYPKRDANISYEERDFIQPYETLNIELGRGCRFKCKYCSFPLLGLKGNMMRDEESVHDELKENYERWGIESYYITDDTVNDSKDKMKMVGDAVRKLNFQPQLNGYARADLLIHHGKETWDDMIDAGFTSHSYGVESFNHESAKTMGKGMHPDKMKDGLLEIQDYFWEKSPYFYEGSMTMICGLPHESFETLDDGKEWLNTYWKDNTVAYLPLFLQQAYGTGDGLDKLDGSITDDFVNIGYTFEENPSYNTLTPSLKAILEEVERQRQQNQNNNFQVDMNSWIHPSGDYGWVDAIDWCRDFISERAEKKIDSTYCFEGANAWMTEYKNGDISGVKDYYKSPAKKRANLRIRDEFIEEYKRSKLSYK